MDNAVDDREELRKHGDMLSRPSVILGCLLVCNLRNVVQSQPFLDELGFGAFEDVELVAFRSFLFIHLFLVSGIIDRDYLHIRKDAARCKLHTLLVIG